MVNYAQRQEDDNACAPACLIAAAIELNIVPAVHKFYKYGDWNEAMIHEVTSKGSMAYSMPGNVAEAALQMGFVAEIHIDSKGSAFIPFVLQLLYPKAMNEAKRLNIRVIRSYQTKLSQNERQLKVFICLEGKSLHYVMRRPDLSYMDPGYGENYHNFTALQRQGEPKGTEYKDSGISVVVRRPAFVRGAPNLRTLDNYRNLHNYVTKL